MAVRFAWDRQKAVRNFRIHGVRCEEAVTAFDDSLSVTIPDSDHSVEEERFLLAGLSRQGRLLVVAYTERRDEIRLISARPAAPRERKTYEEEDP